MQPVGANLAALAHHRAIAGIGVELGRSDILRQSEPAGVGDDAPRVLVMADHAGQHGHRDMVEGTGPDKRLVDIAEHIDAGPHFGDAVEIFRVTRRRGRAGGDHRTRQPGPAQQSRRGHDAGALVLGDRLDHIGRGSVIGLPRMGQHAAQFQARALVDGAAKRNDLRRLADRVQAAAPVAGIDFDQHGKGAPDRSGRLGCGLRRGDAVGQDGQGNAHVLDCGRFFKLRGHEADGIEDIGEAPPGEIARLAQGRDRNAAEMPGGRQPRHIGRFRRLHMRPQPHAQFRHALGHQPAVGFQHRAVKQQARGGERIDVCHGRDHSQSNLALNEIMNMGCRRPPNWESCPGYD